MVIDEEMGSLANTSVCEREPEIKGVKRSLPPKTPTSGTTDVSEVRKNASSRINLQLRLPFSVDLFSCRNYRYYSPLKCVRIPIRGHPDAKWSKICSCSLSSSFWIIIFFIIDYFWLDQVACCRYDEVRIKCMLLLSSHRIACRYHFVNLRLLRF